MKSRSDRTPIAIIVAVALVMLRSGVAHADERTEARRHFRHGMELVVAGQLEDGIAELEVAYNILPHPNVLYNIGRAYAEAGHYEDAIDYFDRYLASAPPDMNEVRGFVAALRERIDARTAATAAAQTTAAATATTATATATPTEAGGAIDLTATQAEIQTLRDAATRLDSLGHALGSTELAGRAEGLRTLASNLEASLERREAHAALVEPTTPEGTEPTATEPTAAEGESLALGNNADDLYEERFVSSTRGAVDPLDAPNSTTIITRQDIRLTGITAIGELLRRVAGVQVMTTGPAETNIGMRGFNQRLSPRVLLLVNGRSTYFDLLNIELWQQQVASIEDIERIEVVRGPASALYGANGFSGIVNVITRTPGAEPSTEFSVNVGNAGQVRGYFGTDGRVGRMAYRFSGSYDSAQRFSLPLDPNRVDAHQIVRSDENLATQGVRTFGHVTYQLGRESQLYAEAGVNYLNPAVIAGTGVFTNVYNHGVIATTTAGVNTAWGGVRFFWNGVNMDGDQFGTVPLPFTSRTNTYDVEATFAHVLHTGSVAHTVVAGAGYRRKNSDWSLFSHPHTENHYQAFAQDSIRLSNRVTLIAGIRMDRHPLITRPIVSPRGALVVRIGDRQALRVSGQTAFRTFSFLEAYFSVPTPTPIAAVTAAGEGSVVSQRLFNRPTLRPEHIVSGEIGYQNQESEKFSFDSAVYFNRVRDIINLSTSTPAFTLADYANTALSQYARFDPNTNAFSYGAAGFANEPGTYYAAGLELVGRVYPTDGLDIWANYSMNMTYRNIGGVFTRETRAPAHQVNMGIQYRGHISDPVTLEVAADLHVQTDTVWNEQVIGATAVEVQSFSLPAFYMINGRVGVRLLDDKLGLGIIGYNISGIWNRDVRQHPFGQQMDARVLGNVSYRF